MGESQVEVSFHSLGNIQDDYKAPYLLPISRFPLLVVNSKYLFKEFILTYWTRALTSTDSTIIK